MIYIENEFLKFKKSCLVVYLFEFYGISTIVGYLTPNPFLHKQTVLFQTIQFSISKHFNYQKYFYSKLFSLIKQC